MSRWEDDCFLDKSSKLKYDMRIKKKRGGHMLKVVAKNYPDSEHMDEILSLCRELVDITRQEKVCISYGVYRDAEHPELLTMIEEWESREDLDNHLHSEHFTRIVPQMGRLMTRTADMNIYQQVI